MRQEGIRQRPPMPLPPLPTTHTGSVASLQHNSTRPAAASQLAAAANAAFPSHSSPFAAAFALPLLGSGAQPHPPLAGPPRTI